MSGTRRVLNRAFLVAIGCLVLAAGLAAVGSWALPAGGAMRDDVATASARLVDRLPTWQAHLEGLGWGAVPWVLLVVPITALVLVVLLCVLVLAQGRGRTRDVVSEPSTGDAVPGSLRIDVTIASAVIGEALGGRGDCAGVVVCAYRVRRAAGARAMTITIAPRKGADIGGLVEDSVRVVEDWDGLLGRRLPVLVHLIRDGRSRRHSPRRVT